MPGGAGVRARHPVPTSPSGEEIYNALSRITFDDGHVPLTITLGHRLGITREPGDVALSRNPHCAMPLKITILLRADGRIDEWYADWTREDIGPYWQFDHGSREYTLGSAWGEPHPPTPAQREAIAKLFFGAIQPFGLKWSVGGPPQQWCAFDGVAELERLGNSGKRGIYA